MMSVTGNHPLPKYSRLRLRALGSNHRRWVAFLANEGQIRTLLANYQPELASKELSSSCDSLDKLTALLPGQTSEGDAKAICAWAELLVQMPDYARRLAQLVHEFSSTLDLPRTCICISAWIANPSQRGPNGQSPDISRFPPKAPGMGAVLASEFFRNLGWSGFKPDRHIRRLFDRWFPDDLDVVRQETEDLCRMIGRKAKTTTEFVSYSLIGIGRSPPGVPLSRVDNLVWSLGAYVERKGRESSFRGVRMAQ